MLRLIGNAIERIGSRPGAKPRGFTAQTGDLVRDRALTAAKTVAYFTKNWTKHIGNLVTGH